MKNVLSVKPGEKGLRKVLTDWQEVAMNLLWEEREKNRAFSGWRGLVSREVWEGTNRELAYEGKSISRASVINFLNSMCDYNVLLYEEETCKGGGRRIYKPSTDRDGFMRKVIDDIFEGFQEDYPLQLYEVVKDHFPTVR